MIIELKYANTNTYLIKGTKGYLLFDTGWAGSFDKFCKELARVDVKISDIKYIIISHFHPDHMGIAQNIADLGPKIIVFENQKAYTHFADNIFEKEAKYDFKPIDDEKVSVCSFDEGKKLLFDIGIGSEIFATPGHSEDSISVLLDSGELFVGDLNPLYELELHKGTVIYESWQKLTSKNPSTVFYGHAAKAELNEKKNKKTQTDKELYGLVKKIIKFIDKGKTKEEICKKTGSDIVFVEDVMRMYLTHQNVGVQGILDRIEIKGK